MAESHGNITQPFNEPSCFMKHPHAGIAFHLVCLLLLTGALATRAANIIKSDTTTMNTAADWSGTAPSSASVGEFDATAQAATLANMTLGGNVTLGGLQFDGTMNGPLTIASTGGYTLTNGTSGINMSAANNDVTLNCALSLGTVANQAQTWTVPLGRTLTMNGAVTSVSSLNLARSRSMARARWQSTPAPSKPPTMTATVL